MERSWDKSDLDYVGACRWSPFRMLIPGRTPKSKEEQRVFKNKYYRGRRKKLTVYQKAAFKAWTEHYKPIAAEHRKRWKK